VSDIQTDAESATKYRYIQRPVKDLSLSSTELQILILFIFRAAGVLGISYCTVQFSEIFALKTRLYHTCFCQTLGSVMHFHAYKTNGHTKITHKENPIGVGIWFFYVIYSTMQSVI
jgi:hypothetical protein